MEVETKNSLNFRMKMLSRLSTLGLSKSNCCQSDSNPFTTQQKNEEKKRRKYKKQTPTSSSSLWFAVDFSRGLFNPIRSPSRESVAMPLCHLWPLSTAPWPWLGRGHAPFRACGHAFLLFFNLLGICFFNGSDL